MARQPEGLTEQSGPDFNADYFEILDKLVEEQFGVPLGEVRPVSGAIWNAEEGRRNPQGASLKQDQK